MRGADQPPPRQGQNMADVEYGFDDGYDHPGDAGPAAQRQPITSTFLRRYVNLAGALTSLGLVIAAGVWGYKLAVRDVRGVPVIMALDEPMRIAPEDPGGEVIDYQGLAVNDVAAVGIAAPLPDRLVLAPRPTELSDEDTAGLAGPSSSPDLLPKPAMALLEGEGPILAADPPDESADPTAIAIDAALAEALGEVPLEGEIGLAEDETLLAPDVELAALLPEGGMAASPRPRARPSATAAAVAETSTVVTATEVDPATIPIGTRLVQFGTFATKDEARAAWVQLEAQFGEVMAGKSIVLQPAEKAGQTFYRLRAHGFEDEAEANRFCAAFAAMQTICIPVPQR